MVATKVWDVIQRPVYEDFSSANAELIGRDVITAESQVIMVGESHGGLEFPGEGVSPYLVRYLLECFSNKNLLVGFLGIERTRSRGADGKFDLGQGFAHLEALIAYCDELGIEVLPIDFQTQRLQGI